jgi:hypothetical protein
MSCSGKGYFRLPLQMQEMSCFRKGSRESIHEVVKVDHVLKRTRRKGAKVVAGWVISEVSWRLTVPTLYCLFQYARRSLVMLFSPAGRRVQIRADC